MSQANTIVRVKLIKDAIDDSGKTFLLLTQSGEYKLWNGVGVRIQCAFFETDEKTLIDPSDITVVTHVVVNDADNSFMLQVKNGPFPTITTEEWNSGAKCHVEFAFSDIETSIAPGSYHAVVFGNTSDSLAAVDFCCQRPLKILNSRIPTAFTNPADAPTLLQSLKDYLNAQLGDYVKKVMAPGETITLRSLDKKVNRILGAINDPVNGPTRQDDIEITN